MMKQVSRLFVAILVFVIAAAVVLAGCASPGPAASPTPTGPFKWPDRMSVISATGVGQAQWVSITSLMQQATGTNISVVPQGAPALRFKSVQQGESLFSAGGASDYKNILEADVQYASKDGGPFQARIVWPFGITYSGYMVRKDSGIKTPADLKAGMKFGDLTTSPGIKQSQMPALLAWGNINPSQVTYVPFATYDAMVSAVKEKKVDVSFVFTTSPKVLEVADECTLIALDPTKDKAAAERFLNVWTVGAFATVQEGPPGFVGIPSNGGITGITTVDKADENLIYNFAKWLDENYAKYKDAHPSNKYATIDNMLALASTSFIPVHPGAIKYLKEKGKWTAANDARQKANIDLVTAWVNAFQDAVKKAEAASISVDPTNKAWIDFWNKYKTDNASKLPVVKGYVGL